MLGTYVMNAMLLHMHVHTCNVNGLLQFHLHVHIQGHCCMHTHSVACLNIQTIDYCLMYCALETIG